MSKDSLYEIAGKIAKQAAADYDPFEKIEVKGPLEGSTVFADGQIYHFKNGRGFVHRKNLGEAYNLGFRRIRPRRQP
jgi:hypothetical protein